LPGSSQVPSAQKIIRFPIWLRPSVVFVNYAERIN
jgi:hypothetical protein